MNQPHWQKLLANGIRDLDQLLDILELDASNSPFPLTNPAPFPLRVPRGFVAKIKKRDWHDPLLLQLLPLTNEEQPVGGFGNDPVGDLMAVSHEGILQKYHGRALVMTTGKCAIHCRYCFRRHFPYADHQPLKNEWQAILSALQQDSSVNEVILSGGDPLSLADSRLQALAKGISQIAHIKRLRIHTRYPLVLPERITDEFTAWLQALGLQTVLVIHANHANEFCHATSKALARLQQSGVLLLNQSVLLKGVNDSTEALRDLSEALIANRVAPYYLHLLDRVAGSAHFEVSEEEGKKLIDAMRKTLPGYMVPRLVREVSGKRSKTPIV